MGGGEGKSLIYDFLMRLLKLSVGWVDEEWENTTELKINKRHFIIIKETYIQLSFQELKFTKNIFMYWTPPV